MGPYQTPIAALDLLELPGTMTNGDRMQGRQYRTLAIVLFSTTQTEAIGGMATHPVAMKTALVVPMIGMIGLKDLRMTGTNAEVHMTAMIVVVHMIDTIEEDLVMIVMKGLLSLPVAPATAMTIPLLPPMIGSIPCTNLLAACRDTTAMGRTTSMENTSEIDEGVHPDRSLPRMVRQWIEESMLPLEDGRLAGQRRKLTWISHVLKRGSGLVSVMLIDHVVCQLAMPIVMQYRQKMDLIVMGGPERLPELSQLLLGASVRPTLLYPHLRPLRRRLKIVGQLCCHRGRRRS